MNIERSQYLLSRRHNGQLLDKLGEDVIGPVLDKFNDTNDRSVKAEWNMSAKYQSITIDFEMDDDDNLSNEFIDFLCFGELAELLSEWFAVEVDGCDCDNRYISVDVGL